MCSIEFESPSLSIEFSIIRNRKKTWIDKMFESRIVRISYRKNALGAYEIRTVIEHPPAAVAILRGKCLSDIFTDYMGQNLHRTTLIASVAAFVSSSPCVHTANKTLERISSIGLYSYLPITQFTGAFLTTTHCGLISRSHNTKLCQIKT